MRVRKNKEVSRLASTARRITVYSLPRERHRGVLRCGALTFQCALGRSGVTHLKREGDGATLVFDVPLSWPLEAGENEAEHPLRRLLRAIAAFGRGAAGPAAPQG